jgi:hypothetical protein
MSENSLVQKFNAIDTSKVFDLTISGCIALFAIGCFIVKVKK